MLTCVSECIPYAGGPPIYVCCTFNLSQTIEETKNINNNKKEIFTCYFTLEWVNQYIYIYISLTRKKKQKEFKWLPDKLRKKHQKQSQVGNHLCWTYQCLKLVLLNLSAKLASTFSSCFSRSLAVLSLSIYIYVVKEHTQPIVLDTYWIPLKRKNLIGCVHSWVLRSHRMHIALIYGQIFLFFIFYLPLRKHGKDGIELHSMLGTVSLYLD